MKNIWILTLVILAALTACNNEPEIVIPQPPEFVQATATPAVVEYDKSTMITWTVKNAEYVNVSVNGAVSPVKRGIKDSLEINNLKEAIYVDIVAYGEESLNTSKTVNVAVLQAPAPKITVTAPSEVIPYGDKATFSWKTEGIVTSVTVNKVDQSGSSFTTPSLYNNAEYSVVAKGPGGTATQKVAISVGYWTTSRMGLMTHSSFKEESAGFYTDGVLVAPISLSEELSYTYFFQVNGDLITTDFYGNKIKGKWEFFGDNYIRFFNSTNNSVYNDYLIVSLTTDELILSSPNTWYGKPAEVRTRYVHP